MRIAYATAEQVLEAWRKLTPADRRHLRREAARRLPGSSYASAAELVLEAFQTAYRAARVHAAPEQQPAAADGTRQERRARRQTGRAWRTHVPYLAYLVNTIRGLASDSRRSWWQSRRRSLADLPHELRDGDGQGPGNPEEQLIAGEDDQQLTASVEQLRADPRLGPLVQALLDNKQPRQILAELGWTRTQYNSTRRALRRALAKLR